MLYAYLILNKTGEVTWCSNTPIQNAACEEITPIGSNFQIDAILPLSLKLLTSVTQFKILKHKNSIEYTFRIYLGTLNGSILTTTYII